ncbi:MAG: recombination regulator RecX [Bacteroidetes bacterium]|nr:recombination regulator RecX [Bacteroidota bacterium]
MRIAKITRRGRKVLINFEDESRVYISYEMAVKHGLRSGDELTEIVFNTLLRDDSLFKIRSSAFRSLARRLHTKMELRDKLIQKEYQEELVALVLNDLEEKGYLDDLLFAEKYIEEKSLRKGLSKSKIKLELVRKGINKTVAEEYLKLYYPGEIYLENAIKHVQKKKKMLSRKTITDQQMMQKIYQSLQYKGYDSGVIFKAINEAENDL